MSRGKRILEQMRFTQEVPPEASPGLSIVEMLGDSRVLIEKHMGMQGYSENEICVKVKKGILAVCGASLTLAKMSKDQLVITGRIECIRFISRGGK